MPDTLRQHYAALVAAGEIARDPAQDALAEKLMQLETRLAHHRLARKSSSLGWLLGRREPADAPLKGLYIFGEVGRGRTLALTTDASWYWSFVAAGQEMGPRAYETFWHGAIRWLVRDPALTPMRVAAERTTFEPGGDLALPVADRPGRRPLPGVPAIVAPHQPSAFRQQGAVTHLAGR